MKKAFLIILLLFCTCNLFSQSIKRIDSVLQLLQLEKREDTIQVRRYIRLSADYTTNNPDSALYYCELAFALSEKLNYPWGIGYSYRNFSSIYKVMGDYPLAWEYLQKSRKVYDEQKDESNILFNEYARGTLSYEQENYSDALKIFLLIKSEIEEAISRGENITFYPFLAATYNNLQMPDSGMYYIKKYLAGDFSASTPRRSFPLRVLGEAFSGLKITDSALFYYHLAYNLAMNSDAGNVINAALGLARVFKEKGNTDSCIHYANIALSKAQDGKFLLWIRRAAKILADAYEKVNTSESIRFYKLAASINDSINDQQKIIQIQNLKYTEELSKREAEEKDRQSKAKTQRYLLVGGIAALALIALLLIRNNRQKQKAHNRIKKAYSDLRETQQQLIQREKMASLGELTAGIAHEIQNPLNFVNNFSEVNTELIDEMQEELDKGNLDDAKAIAKDIKENEQKINHHGKRADSIVKGMLQHSRNSSGQKEPTDINNLVDECMRLSYHGLRAKDKSFNAKTETKFDSSIPKINIISQDIGRVILNLFTNAFYSVMQKKKQLGGEFEPVVSVHTIRYSGKVEIKVRDNGNGIPQKILDKIYQPFFTTKPVGEGTGLGLSMSYEIITKGHGGELKVNTKEGEFAEFIIILPV